MSSLFSGSGSSGTDRTFQLNSWGELENLIGGSVASGGQASNAGSNFLQSILSGDPTKIAASLGGDIGTLTNQGQQQKATNSEFSNRSGGTNATNQSIDTNTRGSIDSLISSLTSGAANSLLSFGLGEQSLAASAAGELGTLAGNARSGDQALQQQQAQQVIDMIGTLAGQL
jgi:hypothetical protein